MIQNIFPKILKLRKRTKHVIPPRPLRNFQHPQRQDLRVTRVTHSLSTFFEYLNEIECGGRGFNNANGAWNRLGTIDTSISDRRLKRYPAVIVSVWRTDGHGSRTGSRSTLMQRVDILIFNGHRFSALWTSKLTTRGEGRGEKVTDR